MAEAINGLLEGRKNNMSKPRMIGMIKGFTPNSKADRKRSKPFGKKGKAKK
jgi:hypothetical protein